MSQYTPLTQSVKPSITSSQSQMDTSETSKANAMVEGTLEQSILPGLAHVRVRECSYTWTITNMSFNLRAYQHDEYIWSSKFQSGNNDEYVFRLLLYPDGCNDEHQDYLCIEIQNYGDTTIEDGQIYAQLAMLHTNGEERYTVNEIFYPQKGKVKLLFHMFMKKMLMMDPSNGLLVDDQVILKCRLYFDSKIVERFIPDGEVRKENVKPDCRLREFDEFEQMLENGIFSDARLRVEGVEFRIHRAVLATRSRVFAEMMSQAVSNQQENKEEGFVLVDVKDVSAVVLRELLRFVYAGKVYEIDKVAKDLLVAAIRFELEGLKTTCEETLVRGLSIENVGEMLAFPDKHKTEMLAKSAMEFFTLNAKRVVGTDNFKTAMQSCPFWITAMVNILVQKLE